MEYRPLSNIHIVAEDPNIHLENFEKEYAYISYLIGIDNMKEIRTIFEKVYFNKEQTFFSVTIEINDAIVPSEEWENLFALLLCHPSYFKSNNRCLIGFQGINTNEKKRNGIISNLKRVLASQGIVKIIFQDTNSTESKGDSGFILFDEKITDKEFITWYLANLTHSSSNLNIITHSNSNAPLERIISLRNVSEQNLRASQHVVYENLLWSRKKGERLQELEALIEDMAEDIDSKKKYLDYLLGKETDGVRLNEIMQIKKFYHTEYEVLPLWYKRFGHIIKVVMGKRTFRSLLDDKKKRS